MICISSIKLQNLSSEVYKKNRGGLGRGQTLGTAVPEKIDRLKEDQAFSLSLELGRRENFLRHPSADLLPTQPQ